MSALGRISTLAVIAVDDDDVARLDPARRIVDPPDDRDVEGARDDRDMRGRRAFLEHQAHDPPMRVIQQLGRPHRAGDKDEFGRQFGIRRRSAGRPDRCCCSRLARSSRSNSRSRR